ncbi:MAG: hypothetical protein RLZ28_933 [Actinomycetota bacterium]
MNKSLSLLFSVLLSSSVLFSTSSALAANESDCTIVGTNKADTILGTEGRDVICAGAGSDTIYALGGDDVIRAGSGNDIISGGAGSDEVIGGSGNDNITGGNGADSLTGGQGVDKISGGSGEDILLGGAGNDNISGGNQIDIIDGGKGADNIRTGAGSDMCGKDSSDVHLDACNIDTNGPQVGALMTNGLEFSAGTTAVFNVKVFDESGTAGVYGSIGGPPGWVTEWCGFLITGVLTQGNEKSGVYQIICDIPSNAVNEKYTLFVKTSDLMGNSGVEISIDFQVGGGSSDNLTPTVTKIDIPYEVAGGDSFTMRVSATDESSVAGIYAWFALEGGWLSGDGGALYVPYSEPRFVSQTQTEAVVEQDVVFDAKAPAGKYRIWLSIRDGVGNRDFYATDRTVILNK